MIACFGVVGFLFGASIGSFLTVFAYRVPRGQSVVRPPSFCDGCKRPLRPHENIPVLSWLIQRGRCRTCDATVPARYPLIEAACGLVGALIAVALVGAL